MDENEINYIFLRKIQNSERESSSLGSLDTGFYNVATNYIIDLQNRLKDEESSQKKILLKDEIQNTKKIINSIYEQREKKIVLAAVTKVRGGNPNLKNLLKSEVELFESIYSSLIKSRGNVFKTRKIKKEKNKYNYILKNEKRENKKVNIKNNQHIIRIIRNIPPFIGTDTKKYILKKGDILTINENMKDMLVKRKVCEELKLG